MPTTSMRGIDVHWERQGPTGAPRTLFLNGSGASLETSRLLLAPFVARLDVVAHDQRGLGKTTVPDAEPTMADFAADAIALLDDIGWDTFRVVGVSFGGMVAQELAVTVPARVERLALVCTSPGGALASYPLHTLADVSVDERVRIQRSIMDTRYTDEYLADPDNELDRLIVDVAAQGARAARSPSQARGEALQLAARSHHDVVDRLGRISCPTLVAGGRYDGIAPPANSEAIAARIPGAELRMYEGGHAFFFQDEAALPEIIEFLGN